MSISFIYCYARSGGTLLNRCLNNLKDVIVMSEVHPIYDSADAISHTMSFAWQAKEWHGIELKANNYVDQTLELYSWCKANKKHLVIRDWSYIDFTPSKYNEFSPCNKSSSFELLSAVADVKVIAFVRNAIDVGLSLKNDVGEFSKSYINYVTYLKNNNIDLFKYEDFCTNPLATMEKICNSLNLPCFNGESVSCESCNVIGDIGFSRGNRKKSVVRLKRKYVSRVTINTINSNELLNKCNQLLGYNDHYSSQQSETFLEYFLFTVISPFGLFKKHLIRKFNNYFAGILGLLL